MNFTCPYCNQITTITEPNFSEESQHIRTHASEFNWIRLGHKAIACPNQNCKKLYLEVSLSEDDDGDGEEKVLKSWKLLPSTSAKPQSDYIPAAIREDYYEACAILDLSPKASATLSRRCLQGIVRNFWDIPQGKRGNLGAELSYIKESVDPEMWDGIQAIRSVGDVGAHMEKDVNYVVDVEPDEAELLKELIEMLFSEWYVARKKRKDRAGRAKSLAAVKKKQKQVAKVAAEANKGKKSPSEEL